MRVLCLIQGFEVAASRYRVLQYIPYLAERGIETEVITYPSTLGDYAHFLGDLPAYDCILLQRKRFQQPLLGMLRKRSKRIVYDFDDAVMYRNSTAGSPYSATRLRRFASMVKAMDYVIAGNTFLGEQAAKFNNHVMVIPTTIDRDRYTIKDYSIKKKRVTIGWIGDHGSIHYLHKLRPHLEELGRRYDNIELKIVCDTFLDCENLPVVKRQWSQETEIDDLRDMDIGLMPLIDDPWSWGKCGLKILQYFGVGVPAVCTPVGVNKDVVRDGINGYHAFSGTEWVNGIAALIENPDKREAMGREGRKIVFESFSVQACAPKFISVLQGTVKA